MGPHHVAQEKEQRQVGAVILVKDQNTKPYPNHRGVNSKNMLEMHTALTQLAFPS
jgi:hypothetical protein